MLKNYFKTALRNLARNKIYSFINIAGLGLGLACAMLIMLYVKDEVSFDRFHKNVNNIYRIVIKAKFNGKEFKTAGTGFLQGPRFTQNVHGIKSFVRLLGGREDIKIGSQVQSQDLLYVDSSFFSVFTFQLLSGNAKTCLTKPNSIVFSEDAAKKQFGTTDAVGKVIMIKNDRVFVPYKVTAVAKRCPQNSSIQFKMLMPIKVTDADWFNYLLNTFVVLDEKANPQTIEKQMQATYVRDAQQNFDGITKNNGSTENYMGHFLQPYLDIHMNAEFPARSGLTNASNTLYSYILSGIALFVLLIACINFVNLSVARSVKRAKEVGIRKVVGGDRKQLITQFLGESFFLCSVAFLLAIALVQLILPLFNNLANKALSVSYLLDKKMITGYILLYVITGLLSGFYPALILSGYNPVQTLYNRFQIAGKNYLQNWMVVLQFTLASFLIMVTFTIYTQFNFLTNTNLGYDDNNLIIVNKEELKHTDAAIFKTELMKSPNILGISAKNGGNWVISVIIAVDSTVENCHYETVDENYLPLLKIPLAAGRNFSPAFPSDSTQSVIVNESFVKKANWQNPIGKTVNFTGEKYNVIGVIKDYHSESLNEKILPQLFTMKNSNLYGSYYIRIKPNSATSSLKWIEKSFKLFYPTDPYLYVFKNDENKRQYADVEKWKQIILFGTVLTIIISCFGLFGLSVLSAEKRTKEIGIRKVLGASVEHIVVKLSSNFIKLVVVALMPASLLAYIAVGKWLQNFPYRISMNWWLFVAPALGIIFIALFTVSFQSIKAALANPVKSLRTE